MKDPNLPDPEQSVAPEALHSCEGSDGQFGAQPGERLSAARTRQNHFARGQAEGGRWLLECRDMWDAFDEDGGVYFEVYRDEAAARREARDIQAHPKDKRLLGAYDLARPLEEQGPGLTLEEFLARP